MKADALNFNIDDDEIIINVILDREDGSVREAIAVKATDGGSVVPGGIGLTATEANAVRDAALELRQIAKREIEGALAAIEKKRVARP